MGARTRGQAGPYENVIAGRRLSWEEFGRALDGAEQVDEGVLVGGVVGLPEAPPLLVVEVLVA